MKRSFTLAAFVSLVALGCADPLNPPAATPNGPSFAIADGNTAGGNPGFFFLWPIRTAAQEDLVPKTGFDASLLDLLEIQICRLPGCTLVKSLTAAPDPAAGSDALNRLFVFSDRQEYTALWVARNLELGREYRVRVSAGGQELGFADVDVVGKLRDVSGYGDREDYVPLPRLAGYTTLPIRFWIAEGTVIRNQSPEVAAGGDQHFVLPFLAVLSGSATDDGNPPESFLRYSWSKVSGPGTVTFYNPGFPSTAALFSAAGTYVVRLSVSDGDRTGTDDLTVAAEEVAASDVVLKENFDDGVAEGWTYTGLWHSTSACAPPAPPSAPSALAYTRDDTCTYNTGVTNSGAATFGVDLTNAARATIAFYYSTWTEGASTWDTQRLQISTDGGASFTTVIQFTQSATGIPMGPYFPYRVDLTPYVGSVVLLRFVFDTVDGMGNDYRGWFIDDVWVHSAAP